MNTTLALKKLRLVVVAALLLAAPLQVWAQGQILADASDVFLVNGPLPNSTVSGTVITNFRIFDDEQTDVPYELTLRDSQSCNNLQGTISVGSKPSNASEDTTVSWASAGPLNDVSSVPDGKYCMQLCVSLKNGTNPYSACNLRVITIRNTNVPPQIVSSPPANRTITVDQSWTYQVQATDANGDAITYSLLNNPAFVTINTGTGFISTTSATKTPATYDITVVARDAFGGTASQAFQLTVQANATTPPASPPPNNPGGPNQPGAVTIVFPVADAELAGETNQVSWTATDPDGIKEIKLAYSTDKNNWLPLATVAGDKSSYVWDVSELTDGGYYLQVSVIDNKGATTAAVSEEFNIANNGTPLPPAATKPLIINVQPEDASSITELRPTIAGEFTPPVDAAIAPATFKLELDETDISQACTVTVDTFTCTLTADLSLGVHKLHAEIESTDEQLALRDWTFTVVAQSEGTPTTEPSAQVNSQTFIIVAVACCLLALLLIIPWALFTLWKKRQDEQVQTIVEAQPVNPADFSNYGDYLAAVSQSTPVPQITTNYYTPAAIDAPVAAPMEINVVSPTASQPVSPPAPVSTDSNAYVTAPDFMSFYSAPTPSTGIENADVNVPDWLRAPDTAPSTPVINVATPVAAPAPEPEVVVPTVTPEAPEPTTTTAAAPAVVPDNLYVASVSPFDTPLEASTPSTTPSTTFTPLPEATSPLPSTDATGGLTGTPLPPASPDAGTPPETGSYGYGRQVDSF